MPITIFQSLKGSWKFERTFRHFPLKPHALQQETEPAFSPFIHMEGTASFNPITESEFHYEEKGLLTVSEKKQFNATQNYIYRLESGQIQVYFNEKPPRLFLSLQFVQDQVAEASHICSEDLYHATYNFLGQEQFSIHYRIEGPRKNYEIHTLYELHFN